MTPGLETGILIGGSSLVTLIISKCRCFYKHANDHPFACGFTDTPIQDDNEIHVKTAMVNGIELLHVGKKQAEDDGIESADSKVKSSFCSLT